MNDYGRLLYAIEERKRSNYAKDMEVGENRSHFFCCHCSRLMWEDNGWQTTKDNKRICPRCIKKWGPS
jgi:rubrerythrin